MKRWVWDRVSRTPVEVELLVVSKTEQHVWRGEAMLDVPLFKLHASKNDCVLDALDYPRRMLEEAQVALENVTRERDILSDHVEAGRKHVANLERVVSNLKGMLE